LVKIINNDNNPITSVALSKDNSFIVTCGLDRSVKLWDLTTGLMIKEFHGHTGVISSVTMGIKANLAK